MRSNWSWTSRILTATQDWFGGHRRIPTWSHTKGTVREYTRDGQVIWEYKLQMTGPATPTHRGRGDNAYSAYRLTYGNTLIGSGNNNRVLEVNPKGDITWSLDQNELPGYKLYWVTQLQALPNNDIVVTNTHAE